MVKTEQQIKKRFLRIDIPTKQEDQHHAGLSFIVVVSPYYRNSQWIRDMISYSRKKGLSCMLTFG